MKHFTLYFKTSNLALAFDIKPSTWSYRASRVEKLDTTEVQPKDRILERILGKSIY